MIRTKMPILFPRKLFWPLFAALMGYAIGGSAASAIDQPNYQQHIVAAVAHSDADAHQPAKTLRQRLSVIWDRTWDDPVAFYTFVLSIFTALVAVISATQIVFLIRTDKLTRISVGAAQKSADALPAVERAYVFLSLGQIGYRLEPMMNVSSTDARSKAASLVVNFNFVNYGKTPAVIDEIKAGVKRLPGDLPTSAWNEQPIRRKQLNILAAGENFAQDFRLGDPETFTQAEGAAVLNGQLFIYFFGHVAYRDVFGTDRETQFCWRVSASGFDEWGGKEHNYRT